MQPHFNEKKRMSREREREKKRVCPRENQKHTTTTTRRGGCTWFCSEDQKKETKLTFSSHVLVANKPGFSAHAKLCFFSQLSLKPTIPGSYFIMAETSACKVPATFQDRRRDYNFCRWLTSEVGVAAIPPSAFYDSANEHLPGNYARFCFIKSDEMLDEAARRLRRYFLKK